MNYSKYTIDIKTCDAQTVMGGKCDDESDEEYAARFKAAEGKFFLRAVIVDELSAHHSPVGASQHIALEGPYFDYAYPDKGMPWLNILHTITQVVTQREGEKK